MWLANVETQLIKHVERISKKKKSKRYACMAAVHAWALMAQAASLMFSNSALQEAMNYSTPS